MLTTDILIRGGTLVTEAGRQRADLLCREGFLAIDASDYDDQAFDIAAGHVMSPPYRPAGRAQSLWQAIEAGPLSAERFVALTSANAAKIFNLWPKKGSLRLGADGELRAESGTGRYLPRAPFGPAYGAGTAED